MGKFFTEVGVVTTIENKWRAASSVIDKGFTDGGVGTSMVYPLHAAGIAMGECLCRAASGIIGVCLAVNGVGTTAECQWRAASGVMGIYLAAS